MTSVAIIAAGGAALCAGLLCLSVAGCSDLPAIAPGSCGNRVLEPGEDCDGASAFGGSTSCGAPGTVNACHYVCGKNGAVCPSGWGCGADGRCRAPSGKFAMAAGSPWPLPARSLVLGDVDGDGVPDLVGEQNATITVRFGDVTGGTLSFPVVHSMLTRQPTGPVSFGLFNNDKRLDAVVPTAGGLFVLLGDAARTFDPVAYSSVDLPFQGTLQAVAVPDNVPNDGDTHVLFVHPDSKSWKMWFARGAGAVTAASDPTLTLAGAIPVGDLDGDPTRKEFAVPFVGASDLRIYTSQGDAADHTLLPTGYAKDSDVALPGPIVAPGAFFADVDGDGDLDLLAVVAGPKVVVALNSGGVFGTAVVDHDFDPLIANGNPILVAKDIDGDGVADYVTGNLFVTAQVNGTNANGSPHLTFDCLPSASSCRPRLQPSGMWNEAVVGDFNGDGRPDLATVLRNREGIDIYYGTKGRVFNPLHIDTEIRPRLLRVGDFDGDFIDDLAFVEPNFGAPDSLDVVFGSAGGGPSSPIEMGKLGVVDSMATVTVGTDNPATRDAIDDLAVVSSSYPSRDHRTLAVLQGSATRRLLSPFVLQPPTTPPNMVPPDLPRAAVFGEFSAKPDGIPDILAASTGADGAEHVWNISGKDGSGALDAISMAPVTIPDPSKFALSCATWAVGDIDKPGVDPRDELVGIDAAGSCAGEENYPATHLLVSRVQSGAQQSPLSLTVDTLPSNLVAPVSAQLVDLDKDGDRDLLVLFAGKEAACTGSAPAQDSAVAVLWNVKGGISTTALSTVQVPSECVLHGLAPISLDDSGYPALLILGAQGIYSAKLDPQTLHYSQPQMLIDFPNDGTIRVGDLNGDGLQDIAVSNHGEVSVWLAQPAPPVGSASGGTQ